MRELGSLWNEEQLLSQMEQQQDEIDGMRLDLQRLQSEKQMLQKKVQQQSEQIVLLNGRIEMLSESDLQLQSAQRMKEDAEDVQREAEEMRGKCLQKMREAESMKTQAAKAKAEAERLVREREDAIVEEAVKVAMPRIREERWKAEKKIKTTNKQLNEARSDFERRAGLYKAIILGLIVYAVTVTFLWLR